MQFENLNFNDFDLNLIKGVISQDHQNLFELNSFIEENFHKKQQEFLRLKEAYILMITGRRPGKSYALGGKIIIADQLIAPGKEGFILFATTTLSHAHELIYSHLRKYNSKYRLGWDFSQYKKWGVILTPNANCIRLMGLHDQEQWKKPQGLGIKLGIVDEAQLIKHKILQAFDEEICSMGRLDFFDRGFEYDSQMVLSGNPPKRHIGHLTEMWRAAGNEDNHDMIRFTMNIKDNPYYTKVQIGKFFSLERKRLSVEEGKEPPTFLRNMYGIWAEETESKIYHIDQQNIFENTPKFYKGKVTTVMGVDMGYHHKDAISVLKYDHETKKIYTVYEWEANKLSYSELAAKIKHVEFNDPNEIDIKIADFGGLGKKAQREFLVVHGLYMIAAQKTEKMAWVEKLKDLILQKTILFKPDSIFIKDAKKIDYAETFDKIDDADFHSDIHDAILYSTRFIMNKFKKDFERTTDAEKRMEAQMQEIPDIVKKDRELFKFHEENKQQKKKLSYKKAFQYRSKGQ